MNALTADVATLRDAAPEPELPAEIDPPAPVTPPMQVMGEHVGVHTGPIQVADGQAPLFWLVGAHGGAGTSSLARMWAPAGDAVRAWPSCDQGPTESHLAVVVARASQRGLSAAADVLRQTLAGSGPARLVVVGLVLVAAKPGRSLAAPLRRYRDGPLAALLDEGTRWDISWHPEFLERDLDELPIWHPKDDPPPRRGADPDRWAPPDIRQVGEAVTAAVLAHLRRQAQT